MASGCSVLVNQNPLPRCGRFNIGENRVTGTSPNGNPSADQTPSQTGGHSFHEFGLDQLIELKKKGFNPSCIFDVGASDGRWSKAVMEYFPEATFHLFEPQVDTSEYQQTMSALIDNHPNTTLHQAAVGAEVGTIALHLLEDHPEGTTSLVPNNRERYTQVETPQLTLDSMIDQGVAVPQLVKMDIQGGELEALRGFENNLSQVDLLLLETWFSRAYGPTTPLIHELIEFLVPYGFCMFELGTCYRNEAGSLISQDFFFVNKNTSSDITNDFYF